jgi:transposase
VPQPIQASSVHLGGCAREENLAIIAEARRPNASVAQVARKHGINANQVFGWLRLQPAATRHDEEQRQGKPASRLPKCNAERTRPPSDHKLSRRASNGYAVPEPMLELVLSDGSQVRC